MYGLTQHLLKITVFSLFTDFSFKEIQQPTLGGRLMKLQNYVDKKVPWQAECEAYS